MRVQALGQPAVAHHAWPCAALSFPAAEAHEQEAALRWRGANDGLMLSIVLPKELKCRRPIEEQIYQVPKDINFKK